MQYLGIDWATRRAAWAQPTISASRPAPPRRILAGAERALEFRPSLYLSWLSHQVAEVVARRSAEPMLIRALIIA
jgi:hypothetical protein